MHAKARKEFGSFEIEPEELEYFEQIGSGSFGAATRGAGGTSRFLTCARLLLLLRARVRASSSLALLPGHVYRGKVRGKECAIKKLKGQDLSDAALEEMRKEVKIMRCVLGAAFALPLTVRC